MSELYPSRPNTKELQRVLETLRPLLATLQRRRDETEREEEKLTERIYRKRQAALNLSRPHRAGAAAEIARLAAWRNRLRARWQSLEADCASLSHAIAWCEEALELQQNFFELNTKQCLHDGDMCV